MKTATITNKLTGEIIFTCEVGEMSKTGKVPGEFAMDLMAKRIGIEFVAHRHDIVIA